MLVGGVAIHYRLDPLVRRGGHGRLYCTVYRQGDVTTLDREAKGGGTPAAAGPKPINLAFAPDRAFAAVIEVAGEPPKSSTLVVPG